MAVTNIKMDATTENVLVIATTPAFKNIPYILSGFDTDEFITVNNPATADQEIGADGTIISYTHPALVTGSFKFAPFSASIAVIQYYKKLERQNGIADLTLYITNPNLAPSKAWFVTLDSVVFKTHPVLSSAGKRFQGMPIEFSCALPQEGLLAEALDIAKIISSAVPFIP